MAIEENVHYIEWLASSERERFYFRGRSPGDASDLYYVETVRDNGHYVAIRQLTITTAGHRHAYSAAHVDDKWGGLLDPLIDDVERLSPTSAADFGVAWDSA